MARWTFFDWILAKDVATRCSDNAGEIAGFSGPAEKVSHGYGRAVIFDLVSAREGRGEGGRKHEL